MNNNKEEAIKAFKEAIAKSVNKKKNNNSANDYVDKMVLDIKLSSFIEKSQSHFRKLKIERKKLIRIKMAMSFVVCVFAITMISNGFKLMKSNIDNNEISKLTEDVINLATPIEIDAEIITSQDNNEISYNNEVTTTTKPAKNNNTTTKLKYLDANITNLKKQNKDTVAWINMPGTNINYPVVQSTDNTYYLNHNFNQKSSMAGWIYMDYRNNADSHNTIIYGHSMNNGSMFGGLKNVLNESWFKNKNNHYIRMSDDNTNTIWQVFAIYKINPKNDYLKVSFYSDNTYTKYLNDALDRSIYDFKKSVKPSDKILTLSTCADNENRLVVHAVKISETTN